MSDILKALLCASEKAARVARSCTKSQTLLISEKFGDEANARFDRDFKTIADVLAQEAAKFEISLHCPKLAEFVRGEECAEINGVTIKLQESVADSTALLSQLVRPENAQKMSEAAHSDVFLPICNDLPCNLPEINSEELGVWIDPIDATAEFISGVNGEEGAERGLSCVTVLIGAYLRTTGEPVAGVINQPFYDNGKGRIIWGVSYKDVNKWGSTDDTGNDGTMTCGNKSVLMSGAEKPIIVQKFRTAGWEVKSVPGAGHKLLKVATGEASAYVVSQGTTFRWDTCGPHAILKAKGGNIQCYTTKQSITYNDPDDCETQEHCNSGGIIAYAGIKIFEDIKSLIC